MSAQQEMLYACNRYALLIIFQAMDAAGKDGAIAHVMSGVNPQGCRVSAFKRGAVVHRTGRRQAKCQAHRLANLAGHARRTAIELSEIQRKPSPRAAFAAKLLQD